MPEIPWIFLNNFLNKFFNNLIVEHSETFIVDSWALCTPTFTCVTPHGITKNSLRGYDYSRLFHLHAQRAKSRGLPVPFIPLSHTASCVTGLWGCSRWCQVSLLAKEPEFLEHRHCHGSVSADVSGALIVSFSELLAGLPPL